MKVGSWFGDDDKFIIFRVSDIIIRYKVQQISNQGDTLLHLITTACIAPIFPRLLYRVKYIQTLKYPFRGKFVLF